MALLGLIGLTGLAGLASACVALANMRGWYAVLTPPPLAPPNPLTVGAWSVLALLYLLTAVSAWRVLRRAYPTPYHSAAMHAWGWQLALSAAWPAMFFGCHAMLAALVIAAALAVTVAVTIRKFGRLDTAAAILLTPNLLWSGFVLYLTAGFWWLNR